MNRASLVGGFTLEQEKDNRSYSEDELRRMVHPFAVCKLGFGDLHSMHTTQKEHL